MNCLGFWHYGAGLYLGEDIWQEQELVKCYDTRLAHLDDDYDNDDFGDFDEDFEDAYGDDEEDEDDYDDEDEDDDDGDFY